MAEGQSQQRVCNNNEWGLCGDVFGYPGYPSDPMSVDFAPTCPDCGDDLVYRDDTEENANRGNWTCPSCKQIGFGVWWHTIGEWDFDGEETRFFGSREQARLYLESKYWYWSDKNRPEVREIDFSRLPPPMRRNINGRKPF